MNTQPETRARANIPVNVELHRRLKIAAAELGVPLTALSTEAIERELARLERLQPRRRDGAA
ncbi:hypothetical protein [Lamprobacter modestohalophilus]|uniref:hypothetical protein n=1 Tax=Lamprobacter modestohalophilus TaxID=1064514 RepID=UPI0019065A5E|nr:hypothetical protein [Lamprobacter modestohalophilus]